MGRGLHERVGESEIDKTGVSAFLFPAGQAGAGFLRSQYSANQPRQVTALVLSNDGELKRLLDRLSTDIVEAGGHARLTRALAAAHPLYENEIRQTPAFWNFTAQGLREACLIRLSRIYDQEPHSLSLLTLLRSIGQNSHFFEDDAVLKRVSRAYAEEFKSGSHRINTSQLESDINLVSANDPLVKKIIVWRSNFGAHLSTKPLLKSGIRGRLPLSEEDVFTLVERSFTISNRYLVAFEGTSFARNIVGENDHQFLFKLLRLGLEKFEESIDRAR